ncbi:hypothetical protein Q3G72_008070 [Acer saccharum]|nr:hypothetical protein Q3G72_008070 [Acer saccharum]
MAKIKTSLDKFLNEKCRSGNVSPDEAHYVFDCMIQRQPAPHMSSFNKLFTALVKNKHYDDVISHFKRFNSTGLLPNLITFNILLNCLCNIGRACDGFVVLGRILRLGFSPNVVTFNSLIKGNTSVALKLHEQMVKGNGENEVICNPNIVSYNSLIDGLCKDGSIDKAEELFSEMMSGESIPM